MQLFYFMYDLIIVGGGPAGATAAIYAARKQLKTVFITSEWGGQSTVSPDIQNWVGSPHISGAELARNLRTHVETYATDLLSIITPGQANSCSFTNDSVTVGLTDGNTFSGKALFVATGAVRRKLDIPGAALYEHKGLTYCASCDGPLFSDMPVCVIGGGNAAFETALQLAAYCSSITLLTRSDTFRADEVTVTAARANKKITMITSATPTAISGDAFVTGLSYRTPSDTTDQTLAVNGIFVEIGLVPNTQWLNNTLALDPAGHIIVDPKNQRAINVHTNTPHRAWAAGDCTDGLYHQNNIAAGDAVKALEDLYIFLQKEHS